MQNQETQLPSSNLLNSMQPASSSASQPVSQPASQPASQPVSQSASQSAIGGNSTAPAPQAPPLAPRSRYSQIIESPDLDTLTPLQKEFLKERWQEQIIWFSRRAKQNQTWYNRIRLTTIVGSIIVPALLSWGSVPLTAFLVSSAASEAAPTEAVNPSAAPPRLNVTDPAMQHQLQLYRAALITGVGLSQLVAICAAVEQFFKFGDRWRHYRRSAELLKTHGWQFFELTGPYAPYSQNGRHTEAFHLFASQVEEIIQSDVDGYVSQITISKPFLREDR